LFHYLAGISSQLHTPLASKKLTEDIITTSNASMAAVKRESIDNDPLAQTDSVSMSFTHPENIMPGNETTAIQDHPPIDPHVATFLKKTRLLCL
jgi:hypothetical protein